MSKQMKPTTKPESPEDKTVNMWAEAMNEISIGNMKKLANLDEYTIGPKTYKSKILKYREIKQLQDLNNQITLMSDWTDEKVEIMKKEASICLEGWNNTDFEECDPVYLEQVLSACILKTKGFRAI